jgi:hypothetical protein
MNQSSMLNVGQCDVLTYIVGGLCNLLSAGTVVSVGSTGNACITGCVRMQSRRVSTERGETERGTAERILKLRRKNLEGGPLCTQRASQHSIFCIAISRSTEYTFCASWSALFTQNTQSAGPVRFLIFCSISIYLLASLVAGRGPQCSAGPQ